jgi:hypothetical protein
MKVDVRWVAWIDASNAEALAPLRLLPGLEVAWLAPSIWLRGPAWNEVLAGALRKVPGLRRLTVQTDGQLLAEGARVPEGWLPALSWRPLRDTLPVALPPALGAVPGGSTAGVRLVRSATERPATAVLTDIRTWLEWVETAPQIRLRALRFAAALDGRIWIEGTPLPTLPGQRFHLREGVAIPCGLGAAPDLDARVLRRWLGLAPGDTAFVHPDERWEIVKAEQFVPAMRSAVRLTAEVLGHE